MKKNTKGSTILLQQAQNVEKVQFYWDPAALAVLSPASRQIEAEYIRRRVGGLGQSGHSTRQTQTQRGIVSVTGTDCTSQSAIARHVVLLTGRTFLECRTCPSGEANQRHLLEEDFRCRGTIEPSTSGIPASRIR